jgi:hypothetical protein
MDAKWLEIQAVDLATVKEKFKWRKGWWWCLWHDADKIEQEYRQFLYLIATNPGEMVVPWTQDMDDFWHEHILDTSKYQADCNTIHGSFIHHNPHVPKGSETHDKAFTKTKTLYKNAFKDKAEKKRDTGSAGCGGAGCTTFMPIVFCATHTSCSSHGHDGGHHGGDTGHSCGHGGDAGHGCGHGCGGHGCGGGGCGGGGCGGGCSS